MAILIGHASIDENGKINGGSAGDQTGKEVCTRTWYSKPWGFVLRCKDSVKAEKMAVACEKGCANDKIGYDQYQRNTLNTQAKAVGYDLAKITTACETDCSAFMTVCAQAAGINIPYNGTNAPTTSTMKTAFSQTGEFDILTDSKYLNSDIYLKRGDILVKAGSHTAMALENGSGVSTSNTTTSTSTGSIQSNTTYGMDVSSYQGTIDWSKVKASNIKFVILRGVVKNGTLDTTFEKNYAGAINNGISVIGVYHYSYALSEAVAESDAANMVSKLNGKKLDIYLDLEWSTQRNLGKAKVTSIAKAYINKCVLLGYNCHIYSNLDWYKNVYDPTALKNMGCKFWVARYSSSDDGTVKENLKPNVGEYIWQYSSKGKVPGISGNVDLNIIYGGFQDTTIAPKSSSTTTTTSSSTYTVVKGDTLSGIGAKLNIDWKSIAELNGIKSPYVINIGQVLKLPTFTNASNTASSNGSTTASSTPVTKIVSGTKLNLKSVNLYASSSAKTKTSTKTGTYYVWSDDVVNNRIRITNSTANVGKSGQITGWIGYEDVKKSI